MSRKLIKIIVLGLALVALLAGTVGCEGFPSPPSGTSSSGGGLVFSQQNVGIWVTGEGKVSVVPDVAILSLGVEAQATVVAEAQSQAAAAMEAVLRELDNYGVAERDIKTQQFNISPVRKWVEDKEVLIGYRVNNMLIAKVREVANAGIIIDAVVRAGGDNIRINSISFSVDDPTDYYKEAREKAMADAELKAKQLAKSGGVKLGEPIYINESGGYVPIVREYFAEAMPAPAAVTPVSPGETEIRLMVQVVYSIK